MAVVEVLVMTGGRKPASSPSWRRREPPGIPSTIAVKSSNQEKSMGDEWIVQPFYKLFLPVWRKREFHGGPSQGTVTLNRYRPTLSLYKRKVEEQKVLRRLIPWPAIQ
uniref:Uncharacterized protein n=1 Tax=Lygus hesperus TaxID=30085 RepID=A0A0K8T2A6_LYGHE